MWRSSQQRMAAEELYSRWRKYLPLRVQDLAPPEWRICDDPLDVWSRMQPMDDGCYIIMHIDNELLGRHIAAQVLVPVYESWGQWELVRNIPAGDITWMELHLPPVTLELSEEDASATNASPVGPPKKGHPLDCQPLQSQPGQQLMGKRRQSLQRQPQ